MSNFRLHKDDGEKKPTRFYSSQQEKDVAKAVGGRRTANSGATPFSKGDVTAEDWLFECKTQTKDKETFTLRKEWFEKNLQESLYMGKKYNAIVFNFGPSQNNYYVVDEITFKELIGDNGE